MVTINRSIYKMPRLKPKEREEVVRLLKQGYNAALIGRKFNKSRSGIWKIAKAEGIKLKKRHDQTNQPYKL